MRPINSKQRWFAAAVCVLVTSSFATAEEGVVRISDGDSKAGVVNMAGSKKAVQQTAYAMPYAAPMMNYNVGYPTMMHQGHGGYMQSNPYHTAGYGVNCAPMGYMSGGYPAGDYCPTMGYCDDCCDMGTCCDTGDCCEDGCGEGCSVGFEGCGCGSVNCKKCRGRKARKMARKGADCDECFYGPGYNKRVLTLFARATPKGSCDGGRWPKRWWRGQQLNYLARNQRLSNTLFGWMVPSGCNGQGCPPVGKYCVTYADQPGFADPRDGGAYGVQGYGVPVSVPLAPNVRQAYNYSWGTPSSRITQIGTYNPSTTPQPLYHQTW